MKILESPVQRFLIEKLVLLVGSDRCANGNNDCLDSLVATDRFFSGHDRKLVRQVIMGHVVDNRQDDLALITLKRQQSIHLLFRPSLPKNARAENNDAKIALPDALGDLIIETMLEADPGLVIGNVELVLQSLVKRCGYNVHIFGRVAQEQLYLISTHRILGRVILALRLG
jgi:hypothetical protein